MFFISPIPEDKATQDINAIYRDIKDIFTIENVPLMFQYIANYPEYLTYIWERMRNNLLSDTFTVSMDGIEDFAQKAIHEIYVPSSDVAHFITTLPHEEKEHIAQTIKQLKSLNTKLMILTIGVRESIKGIQVGVHKIQQYADPWTSANNTHIDTYHDKARPMFTSSENSILAPLFGKTALVASQYTTFFTLIAHEMAKLATTEAYLLSRVTLEQQGLQAVSRFSFPLECSYQELMRMIGNRPHADELVHILSVTFPSQFPKLVLTSAVMKKVLYIEQDKDHTQ